MIDQITQSVSHVCFDYPQGERERREKEIKKRERR